MSVENPKVIDFVSLDKNGNIVLTISDHLEWDDKNEHLTTLQSKLNAYLEAVENGSLFDQYPNARNKKIIIQLTLKYFPSETGLEFIERVKGLLELSGFGFAYKQITHQ